MSSETQRLEFPIPVGRKQRERYKEAGIVLSMRRGMGYQELSVPGGFSSSDLAQLSPEDLHDLIGYLESTSLKDLLDEAIKIQELRKQAESLGNQEYVYTKETKPIGWEIRDRTNTETVNQLMSLERKGISQSLIGLEIEFSCPENSVSINTHWESVRETAISNLGEQIKNANDDFEIKRIREKILAIEKFNAREMLMYDLIELDQETSPYLEQLFGAGSDGDGYYDGRNVLELKIKPQNPDEIHKIRQIVLRKIYEKATEYGLNITSKPSYHVSVSFWDEDGNIFDDKHPKFDQSGKLLAEGITRAMFDALPVLISNYDLGARDLKPIGLEINREGILRFSSGRIEVRPAVEGSSQNVELMILLLLAGANYGLEQKENDEVHKAQKVESPVVNHVPGKCKVTSHVIGNSSISANGYLVVPQDYIAHSQTKILYELGLIDEASMNVPPFLQALFGDADEFPYIIEFFNHIRIVETDEGDSKLEFPTTSDSVYEFILPEINMDVVPREIRQRMERGEEIPYDEWSFIRPGDRIPSLKRKRQINVGELQDSISIIGIRSKFVVPGYNSTTFDLDQRPENSTLPDYSWSRYRRLVNSQALSSVMPPDFFEEFCDEVLDYIDVRKEDENKLSEAEELERVKEEFVEKILDGQWKKKEMDDWQLAKMKRKGLDRAENFVSKYYEITFERIRDENEFRTNINLIIRSIVDFDSVDWSDQYFFGTSSGFECHLQLSTTLFWKLRKAIKKLSQPIRI